MNTLIAEGCRLIPQAESHAQEMYRMLCDPAIYEFENAPPQSREWLAARYARLEARQSADKKEQWLNWVIQIAGGELIGYVQATIVENGVCYVAYELSSQYWRRGFGRSAVTAMLRELATTYQVKSTVAVLKAQNFRSHGLLVNLGFCSASEETISLVSPEADEIVMVKSI